ncbi:MAG: hypothetical protein KAT83_02880 [Candidatus Aenigmarchaeota archaeon]|nr:hypothetical protein [Candidatus Aenigmarchaeota archaeon]
MDVNVNLFYNGAAERFAKTRFKVNNVQKLLNYVRNMVAEEYQQKAHVRRNISKIYRPDGQFIREESELPELGSIEQLHKRLNQINDLALLAEQIGEPSDFLKLESAEYSIDILFEQSKEKTPDTTKLVDQIDKLFGECKHYTPIKPISKK